MTEKDLADMMEAEEKRLGLHSREFMERHFEIMRTGCVENLKSPCQSAI